MTLTLVIVFALVMGIAGAAIGGATGFCFGVILGVILLLLREAKKRVAVPPPINPRFANTQSAVFLESLPTSAPQYPKPRKGRL